MRIAFILFYLAFSSLLFSQNNFTKQLQQIINDSANHFQKFKGLIQETPLETESSYYSSTITLEGTNNNLVIIHRSICSYGANIADSVTKNKGKKILDEWRIKLMSVLGTGYKMEKDQGLANLFIDGWKFNKNNFSVSLNLSRYFYDKSLCGVTLFISNVHPTLKGL